MLATILFFLLALLLLFSPWLVKWGLITKFQREKLKILIFYQIPGKFIVFLLISTPAALFYAILYLINGSLKPVTEANLPQLTIYLPGNWESISFDDFGLIYHLSGWWNILFLAMWFNLMRYLYKIVYRFKFPYSKLEYSSYLLLIVLSTVMIYFSFAGGSPLYGLAYDLVFLIFYSLVHTLICLGIWLLESLGIERV